MTTNTAPVRDFLDRTGLTICQLGNRIGYTNIKHLRAWMDGDKELSDKVNKRIIKFIEEYEKGKV